jgi:UDP-N-acetylglucosamine 2-epimerase (non-hydrolysing)
LSLSKKFFSRHLSPDKTRKSHLDFGIPVPDYIEENVSTKVVKIIQSYVGIVNKMVWRKI